MHHKIKPDHPDSEHLKICIETSSYELILNTLFFIKIYNLKSTVAVSGVLLLN